MATYIVKPGDNLSKIGQQFGVPYTQITGYKSGNPNVIYPGEVLNIPTGGTVAVAGGGGAPTPSPTPRPTPTSTPSPAPAPTSSGNNIASPSGAPPYAPDTVNQTVYYNGRTWKGNPGTGWMPEGGGTTGATTGLMATQPSINLPDIYKNLYSSSGISDLEAKLSAQERSFNEAQSKISDNPFLSEASRVGRIQKLQTDYNNATASLRNEVAMKKADIETQLNLQTKQFDINSQATQQAWNQFNTLLQMGALTNASGEDIANITRSTGISSDIIQSAIKASQKKNVKNEMVKSEADDGTVTVSMINTETGEVVKQTNLGKIGNVQQGPKASVTEKKAQEEETNRQNLITSIKNYNDLQSIVNAFQGALSIEEIYRLYNSYSPFGAAKESLAQVKQGKFSTQKGWKKEI